jgi:hypothetical protein
MAFKEVAAKLQKSYSCGFRARVLKMLLLQNPLKPRYERKQFCSKQLVTPGEVLLGENQRSFSYWRIYSGELTKRIIVDGRPVLGFLTSWRIMDG